jgi:hypothetical protein
MTTLETRSSTIFSSEGGRGGAARGLQERICIPVAANVATMVSQTKAPNAKIYVRKLDVRVPDNQPRSE